MMDAQDRQELLFRIERLLVDLGPTLYRASRGAYREAAAVVSSIVSNHLTEPGQAASQLYEDAMAMRRPASAAVHLPSCARGQYPFAAPTAHLRDQQADIEAMLAPLSDRRRRASDLARHLKPATL